MKSSSSILLAALAVTLAACGSEGGVTPPDLEPGSEQPDFNGAAPLWNPTVPPDSFGDPPTLGQQPSFNPETPGTGTPPSGGGGGSNTCQQLCSELVALGCGPSGQLDQCVAGCVANLANDPCGDLLLAAYACAFNSPSFSCTVDEEGDVELNLEDVVECFDQFEAAQACQEGQQPEPPSGTCTPEGDQCEGCTDVCDACICALGDEALCVEAGAC